MIDMNDKQLSQYQDFCNNNLKDFDPSRHYLKFECSNERCNKINYSDNISYATFLLRKRPNGGCCLCGSEIVCSILEK
jgi:hypothetical protein